MSRHIRSVTRAVALIMTAVGCLAAFGVATASATITQTAITTPSASGLFQYQFNDNVTPAPTVTISGTTNATVPGTDAVDINCYYNYGSEQRLATIAGDVKTTANGAFSYTGTLDLGGTTCTSLRAVPTSDTAVDGLSAFTGPSAELDYLSQYPVSGTTSPFYDFYDTATSTSAYDDYESAGSCGLESEAMGPGSDLDDEYTWDCADALYGEDANDNRSEIAVDGQSAYDSSAAEDAFTDADTEAGFPAVTSSYTRGTSPDNATITESENLVLCPAGAAFPPTAANCPAFSSSGVSFARTFTQTQGGQVVTVTDTYTSTDGRAHTVNPEYDNDSDVESPVWDLPGSSGFANYAGGDTSSLSGASSGVIYLKDGEYQDGSYVDGPGALIYSTQPSSASFYDSNELLLAYQENVPAGGSVSITQTYVTAFNQATLQKLVSAQQEQTIKPTVTITAPAVNTVTSGSSVQVSGTASAYAGLTLTVDGEAVGVNPNGSWSTAVSLTSGTNTITATATDDSGNTAGATDTVTYAPVIATTPPASAAPAAPAAQQFCIVPNVVRDTLAKAKAALKAGHCSLGKVTKVTSKTFGKGKVEHASAPASVVYKLGAKIGLTESTGKPKVKKVVKKVKKKVTKK